MSKIIWHLATAPAGSKLLGQLLDNEWEPFTVAVYNSTVSSYSEVWLRKSFLIEGNSNND